MKDQQTEDKKISVDTGQLLSEIRATQKRKFSLKTYGGRASPGYSHSEAME